jgi:septal ring factor EnvC (AmiA/AmiB activator)
MNANEENNQPAKSVDKIIMTSQARALANKKIKKRELEEELKQVNKEIEKLELALAEIMSEHALSNFTIDELGQFILAIRTFPTILNEEKFFAWLEAQGDSGLIKRTVHPQTLRAYFGEKQKEFEEKGGDLRAELNGIIGVFEKVSIMFRRKSNG